MSVQAATILSNLSLVELQRQARASEAGLESKVTAIKRFQQRRFSKTYADLLVSPRYGAASRFFLNELYGPTDFAQRDAQFVKVVPALVRLFPAEVVNTVAALAELHAVSEMLDSAMARALLPPGVGPQGYLLAWQKVGGSAERASQIALTVEVAGRLDRITRNPLLRSGLRLMRAPAAAAGLADLQRFLESGFDTFAGMNGSREFVTVVHTRETELASALFGALPAGGVAPSSLERALRLLPEADRE
jgi:hypothetical protein